MKILVIGGYGNFGRFISEQLTKTPGLDVIIAGRSLEKAQELANSSNAQAIYLDITKNIYSSLATIKPKIVIHTSGPYQSQNYDVAKACIACGSHYIDLADSREFVQGISSLDADAKKARVAVISGASSVPCLTSALLDACTKEFKRIDSVNYGITTAQKTTRGLATTAAILSYTGKPFHTFMEGKNQTIYGWQSLHARKYSQLGWRLLGNCDVPDLALFPERYPSIQSLRFFAGLELSFLHITLWFLSWWVRIGVIKSLAPIAPLLLKLSFLFDGLGSANSGFHMDVKGEDQTRTPKTLHFELTAKNGDGPYIPCIPAILLTQKIFSGELAHSGAQACIGLISKEEYLQALKSLQISWTETVSG